jgi:hypothetical protein
MIWESQFDSTQNHPALVRAYKADPSFVHPAHVAVHGVVILPFRD